MMAHPLSTPLDAAEMFTARGWVVFPCDHPDAGLNCTGSSRACRDKRCRAARDPMQRGKCPRVPRWGQITEPADAAQRAAWWGRGTIPTNIAVACGPSGLLIVDEDEPGAFRAYCQHEGHELPQTFTVTTGRGQHYYFTVPVDPQTGQRVPVGNSPGQLAAWHCDVRGGASASGEAGGYAITAGSKHASDADYIAPDPYAEAIVAPDWLVTAIMTPGPPLAAEGQAAGAGTVGGVRASDGARWDDTTRYGTEADLRAQFERHCDEVAHEGGEFRYELFRAARDGWRLVHLGLIDEGAMFRALEACVWRVWGAEPDDRDHVIVFDEARPAALASPWELTGAELRSRASVTAADVAGRTFLRPSEAAAVYRARVEDSDQGGTGGVTSEDVPESRTTDGNRPVEPITDRDQDTRTKDEINRDTARRRALERLDAEQWARDAMAARDAPEFIRVRASQRKDRPRASYLVPGMLYRNGLACIFGAPTCGKTYFILDIGLCFATGKMWRGHRLANADGTRGVVHYVMAEGEDSNNGRIDAWHHYHETTDDDIEDTFYIFPQKVMLTEVGIRTYLPYVREDKPDLIILDTRNLMFVGRESQGEDYAEMLNALHTLQREAGGCCIVLIDHVGLKADDRARGNNAQKGGIDTEILVVDDDGLRMAEVTKDRSAPLGTRWYYRLFSMDEVSREPHVAAPAVVVEAERDPFVQVKDWWLIELPEDREEKIANARNDKGEPAEGKRAALDVLRILLKVRGDVGKTESEIYTMILEKPVIKRRGQKPRPPHSRSSVGAAMTLLTDIGAIETSGTGRGARYTLAPWWRQS